MKPHRLATVVVWLVVGLTFAATLGPTVASGGLLLRSDVVYNHAPFSEEPPAGFVSGVSGTDPVDTGFPTQRQFFARASERDFATWNPYVAGGTPLGSVTHAAPFDPFNWPWLLTRDGGSAGAQGSANSRTGETWVPLLVKLTELMVALAGTALLLRRLGTSTAVALLGGLIYAFSGFQIAWTNWPQGHVGAVVPWLFLAGEGIARAVESGRAHSFGRNAVGFVACVVAMALGGFPAVTAYALIGVVCYVAVRCRSLRPALAAAGLGLGGLALTAWQLLPTLVHLRTIDLAYRNYWPFDSALQPKLLLSAVFPNLFGSYELGFVDADVTYFDYQSFLGAAAVVLVVVAWRRRLVIERGSLAPPGVVRFLLATAGVCGLLIYVGGPFLWVVQQVPMLGANRIDRLRALLLFALAVLAALGLSSVVDGDRPRELGERRAGSKLAGPKFTGKPRLVAWIVRRRRALGAVAVAAASVGVVVGVTLGLRTANRFGELRTVAALVAVAVGSAAVVVVAVAVLTRQSNSSGRRALLIGVVALAVAAEVTLFATPFFPNTDPEHHYPNTATHEFLTEPANTHLPRGGRVASHFLTLYPGTTAYYEIRTVSGHAFHWPTWAEMIERLSPGALRDNSTFSVLDLSDPQRWRSPLLDRFAARWVVNRTDQPLSGNPIALDRSPTGAPLVGANVAARVAAEPNATLTRRVRSAPLRGVSPYFAEPLVTADARARLRVDVTGPDGVTRTGWRAVYGKLGRGEHWIPVAGEDIPVGGEMTISITHVAADGEVTFAANDAGEVLLLAAEPIDDGLRLAQTQGAAVWENTDALARVRFASTGLVVPNLTQRLDVLAQPLDADVVVLSAPPDDTTAGSPSVLLTGDALTGDQLTGDPRDLWVPTNGTVIDVRDSADELSVTVRADAPGYVVVADAMQHGWVATVNGEPAQLLHADHAMVAVAVDAGTHTVKLRYSPPGLRAGLAVSGIAGLVALGALAGWAWRARYRRDAGPRDAGPRDAGPRDVGPREADRRAGTRRARASATDDAANISIAGNSSSRPNIINTISTPLP